jgi:predicted transcriptional regulator of viral defense system
MRGKPRHRGFVASFLEELQRQGLFTFTEADLRSRSLQSRRAILAALWRSERAGRIVRPIPKKDFFVIVPPEYHSMGAPPSTWYLDALFKHLGLPYYVGLITAAQWHGATHFPSQETQVVTTRQLRPIVVGRESIRFFTKRTAATSPVESRRFEQAELKISTPEATAVDLIHYSSVAGGMNNVTAALAELKPRLNAKALIAVLRNEGRPVFAQRLGVVFEFLSAPSLAEPMRDWLKTKRVHRHLLDPKADANQGRWNDGWRIRENTPIEVVS